MVVSKTAHYLLLGFFYLLSFSSYAQDQRIADRLAADYERGDLQGEAKLELLAELAFNEVNDYQLGLKYAEELIIESEQLGLIDFKAQGYYQKGSIKKVIGELEEALEAFFKCIEIAKSANKKELEGSAYGAIADTYVITDNHDNAMLYYGKSISTLRNTTDKIALASFILNAGDALMNNKKYDSALVYFKESGTLFEEADYIAGKAYNLGNIGMVHAFTGKNELAEKNINQAISILEASEDYYPISVYLMAMADIYLEKAQHQTAINYAKRSLNLAEQFGLKEQLADANNKLAVLYEHIGNPVKAYAHYKAYIDSRDSLLDIEKVKQLADQRTDFEVSQKQTELDLTKQKAKVESDLAQQKEKNQRNIIIGTAVGLVLSGFMAVGLFRRNKFIQKTKLIIEKERDRSDKLLLNILPEETAAELKANGKVKAKKYEAVTVLFSDFKGFTSYSEKLSPEELVETIGFYFSKFDEIIEKHGLEKIKTIGDAYMCAGGLHDSRPDHAQRMVLAAKEIAAFVEAIKKDSNSNLNFDIRIGINTGPVVAGVVGTKKFAYDIWGDTVNVASRMESMSEAGKINVSKNTYEDIKDTFECEYRGEIEAKNRGKIKMYFVKAAIEKTSKDRIQFVQT
jgi:class 3 adenylate cyclase